jgi:hypothetical protein
VILASQQSGAARRRIEAREAQPVDCSVAADESGALHVADQRIVLEAHRAPSFAGCPAFRREASRGPDPTSSPGPEDHPGDEPGDARRGATRGAQPRVYARARCRSPGGTRAAGESERWLSSMLRPVELRSAPTRFVTRTLGRRLRDTSSHPHDSNRRCGAVRGERVAWSRSVFFESPQILRPPHSSHIRTHLWVEPVA